MDEYQDQYQGIIDELDKEIGWCRGRRDAHQHGSAKYWSYQRRAEAAVEEAEAWERAAPILADLDARIEDAERRVRWEDFRLLNAVGAWHRGAWWCGAVGALLLLVCWWWIPTAWLPVTAILLLAVAAVCAWRARHMQNLLGGRVTEARNDLATLGAERRRHLPTSGVGGPGGVGETARVDPLFVPGKVHPGRAGANGVGHPFGGGDTRMFGGPVGEGDHVRR